MRWGNFVVVRARGELSAKAGEQLREYVLKIQGEQPVILDLLEVPHCDVAGIAAIRDVRQLLDEQAWAFAIVADPSGSCAESLETEPDAIETYSDKRAARSALHHAAL
jgi:anti-anti-sigma regulatory factor